MNGPLYTPRDEPTEREWLEGLRPEDEYDVLAFTGICQGCGSYWDVRQQPVCPCGGEVL